MISPNVGRIVLEPAGGDRTWPAEFTVAGKRARHRGKAVGASTLVFETAEALRPNWVADVVVEIGGERFAMFVNVLSCRPAGSGFVVTAQPFALSADERNRWLRVIVAQPRLRRSSTA